MRTIIEPFKIKSVEPIHFTTAEERAVLLKEAHYNPFLLRSRDVIIDLLTDSGTGAMSSEQWAGVMRGDESYAGSDSFFRFEAAVRDLTHMPFIIPVHQGRAAEKILFTIKGGIGKYVVSNTLFDTTRANIEFSGALGVDLLTTASKDPSVPAPFKGNMDTERLREFIQEKGAENISLIIMTVTNNSGGGQPVSMANIREVKSICLEYKIPFFIDACRFAENCYFIQQREPEFKDKTVKEIAQELFSYADGCTMSAKKDAFANIGGFLAVHDQQLAEECRNLLIITEGFPTYGGLSGRDLEAIAIGLKEIVEEDYLKYRIRSIEYIGEKLDEFQVPYLKPTGGHALYLDAKAFLPHIPAHEFPGQALCAALYLEGGIRGVEIGSVMFGEHAQQELVRLAIPRRTYTQSHMDYLTEVIIAVFEKRSNVSGMKMVYQTPFLRHFTAKFELVK
ncbi:tryptophanase [Mucilaginibacter auburnensis]|uniref:Tryptophanase n=1 Tax=Mucilaginibacter auburnensis TaxID=1457233 RepID=A0A2H9VL31_9SPHI|nr:tryptophanase [Mucilaginibacter auburnensis]PJJ79044.1 tryptophanase [Mucilaginibacter auburnensis]